jgi:hypothetical protein
MALNGPTDHITSQRLLYQLVQIQYGKTGRRECRCRRRCKCKGSVRLIYSIHDSSHTVRSTP